MDRPRIHRYGNQSECLGRLRASDPGAARRDRTDPGPDTAEGTAPTRAHRAQPTVDRPTLRAQLNMTPRMNRVIRRR